MKVIFKGNADCDYFDHRLNETYPKYFQKWDEVRAAAVENEGNVVTIDLYDGDAILNVPRASVEIQK